MQKLLIQSHIRVQMAGFICTKIAVLPFEQTTEICWKIISTPTPHKHASQSLSACAGYLGSIHGNGHGSASTSRLSGDKMFTSFRSQKLEVQAGQWHRAELVLPNIPRGARYARLVLSGRMDGHGQPQEQLGPRFTQPHLSWGSHRAQDTDDAVLFYTDISASLRLLVTPDSIPSILDDDSEAEVAS